MATVNPFIEFNGVRYYRDKQGWRASPCKGHERLARAVWRSHYGEIPKSQFVACKDGDKWNNDIQNLELRTRGWTCKPTLKRDRWNEQTVERLLQHLASGMSQSAISREMGIPQGTLHHKIKSLRANGSLALTEGGKERA